MSFKARLSIDGKDFNILEANYHLFQETDLTGRPSSVTRGGTIHVTIESTDDTTMADWMINSFDRKKGALKFFKRDSETAIMKQVDFEEAYLVDFNETFSHDTNNPMVLALKISAKKINIGGAAHENEWPI
jgi:hypothetical protein